jgi:NADPH:quinone reductase-like Zn-dependent oxidoreductase
VTEGRLEPGQWVLTLGTGGVSVFVIQIAKLLGARVIVTSSSDEKLARARALGADVLVNYQKSPRWDKDVLDATKGQGADIVVETAGIATMSASLKAARAGGLVAVLGGVTGLSGEVNIAPLTMKGRVHGILVDSRTNFEARGVSRRAPDRARDRSQVPLRGARSGAPTHGSGSALREDRRREIVRLSRLRDPSS